MIEIERALRPGPWPAGVALALLLAVAGPGEAGAQAPNTGRIGLAAGVDVPTAYFFRGILQEDQDYILQPYGELTSRLVEQAGPVSNLGLTLGVWNSLHGGPTGVEGPDSVDPRLWYEADFYARLGATFFEDLTGTITYTAYMSPNDSFGTVEEVALGLGYNDARLLGRFALNPSAVLAFELDGEADGGRHQGVYLQLGIAPAVTVLEQSRWPVTLSLPLTVGLSLADYYEFGTGDDDTFGYVSGGVTAAVPLAFVPPGFGAWQLRGSLSVLTLGDNLKAVNNGDRTEVVGSLGLGLSY